MEQRDDVLHQKKVPFLLRDTNLEKVICIVGLALVTLFLCWQAIYRYCITQFTEGGGGAAWAEEGARYLFVAISYMAIPIAIRRRSLIRVDMVVNMFPEKLKGLSWVTADLACLALALIELYTCTQQWLMFMSFNSIVGAYGIPMIIPYAVVPISFLLITVRLLQDIAGEVKKSGIAVLLIGIAIAIVLMLPILFMVEFSAAACLFLYFGFFVFLGVLIAFSLGLAGVCCIFCTGTLTIGYLGQLAFSAIGNSSAIICVPLFILAGNFMGEGGLSSRLFDILDEVLGGIHGGMAIATVGTCMIFAAMSGSGPATVAAVGSLTVPAMVKRGYMQAQREALRNLPVYIFSATFAKGHDELEE